MAKKLSLIFLLVFLTGVLAYAFINAPKGVKTTVSEKTDPGLARFSLVNINTAGEKELDTLPAVGPSTAKMIIEYRIQNGKFKTIAEIKNVKGIGEKTFEKLKERISAE